MWLCKTAGAGGLCEVGAEQASTCACTVSVHRPKGEEVTWTSLDSVHDW